MENARKTNLGKIFAFELFEKTKHPIFVGGREYTDAYSGEIHPHDFVQVWYCCENFYYHRIRDTVYRCEKGSVVVVPVGAEHNVWTEGPAKVLNMNVHYDFLLEKAPRQYKNAAVQMFLGDFFSEIDPDYSPCRMLSPQSQKILEKVFSWFVLLGYEIHSTPNDDRIWEEMEEVFSLPEFSLPEADMEKALHIIQNRVVPTLKIVSYLNDHYGERITDVQLQQAGSISRAVMYRYFKRLLGDTYAVYLQKIRVRRAHLYMKNTTYSLTQIAQICGFSDVSHMSRAYTKYRGHSPKVQRQRLKELYQNKNT